VPFDALCVAAKLAAHNGTEPQATLEHLERWAQATGGELNEGRVVWLPAVPFDNL
jgi:hypothetical protein